MRLTRDFGESRMRELRTSGSTRGRESGGHWFVPLIPCFPLYSTEVYSSTNHELATGRFNRRGTQSAELISVCGGIVNGPEGDGLRQFSVAASSRSAARV